MNHFDFKNDAHQLRQHNDQNNNFGAAFGGISGSQMMARDAYKELVSLKTTPQKAPHANSKGIYQPCDPEANNSISQSI